MGYISNIKKNLKKWSDDISYRRFFLLNFLTIGIFESFLLFLNNGNKQNKFPWVIYIIILFISAFIIIGQYPILNLRKNWFYKTIVFYLSMVVFLFFMGFIVSVIGQKSFDLLDGLKGGIVMNIGGQLFGGLFVFPGIVVLNWLAKDFVGKQ